MVLLHAMQDIRAFNLLEGPAGRDFVLSLIDEGQDIPLSFDQYPREDSYLLGLRERVNLEIAKRL